MSRFEETDKGTVIDHETGLEWQAEPAGPMDWDDAQDYAESLDLGGHTDWRVPDRFELESLLDLKRFEPASAFPGMPGGLFWSSSVSADYTGSAWLVNFSYGDVYDYGKYSPYHVRCVRRVIRSKGVSR